jgi:hypothetical protein
MDNNIVEFLPREEREELAMRAYWLAVSDDRDAMGRVAKPAERVADVIGEIDEITDADRLSLLWHVSLIRELAVPRSGQRKRKHQLKPLCSLPRFDPPDGAA